MPSELSTLDRELLSLRRAQMILNASPTASMADKRRISDRVVALMEEHGLVAETEEETAGSPMF